MNRKRIIFDEVDEGSEWVASYHLGNEEYDDVFDDTNNIEILFNAKNFDIAVRYAQQYLRKMQSEEETSEQWQDAQILSVELH